MVCTRKRAVFVIKHSYKMFCSKVLHNSKIFWKRHNTIWSRPSILGLPVLYRYPHMLHQYLLSWIFNDILKSFRFPCKHIAALNIGGYLAIHNIHIYRIIFSLEPLSDCLVAPPSGSYWHANSVQTPHITSRLTYSIDWLLKTLSKQFFWEEKKTKNKLLPLLDY